MSERRRRGTGGEEDPEAEGRVMPETTEYYVIVPPGEGGADTILLHTAEGPRVAPVFTQKAKANHFLKAWKGPGCFVRSVKLPLLLEHLRWLLRNGVPLLIVDPDSTSSGVAGEILHFLTELEQDTGA